MYPNLSNPLKILLAAIVIGSISACSVVPKFYRAAPLGEDQKANLVKPTSADEVIIDNVEPSYFSGEIANKKHPNYIVIGESHFKSKPMLVSEYEIKAQALSVGASVVFMTQGYLGSIQTGSVTNAVPIPGAGAIAFNNATSSDINEYHLIYMAKNNGKKERLGFGAKDLPADIQQKLERNKGVVVSQLVTGSPAFNANLLIGDILIAVDGQEMTNSSAMGLLVRTACRKEAPFTLTVLRGNDAQKRDLTINECM